MTTSDLKISVVIPVYNEEENLEPLLDELYPVLYDTGFAFEVICVDDASTDNSVAVLLNLKDKYAQLRIIQHNVICG
jgi:dolichol-phosphate mannosyltransferase